MAQPLHVEIVEMTERVFHGEATQVTVRTTEGEMGILSGHVSSAGVLEAGRVVIDPVQGQRIVGRVDGGFVTVDANRVTVVADSFTTESGRTA